MNNNEQSIVSLLSVDGKMLENIKFLPGTSRGLTTSQVRDEAVRVVTQIGNEEFVSMPPSSGLKRKTIAQFIETL